MMRKEAAKAKKNNIEASLRSAQTALDHLERSLDRGGFKEGKSAYQKMVQTLLAQRLVSSKKGTKFDEPYAKLGETAKRINALLQPYADVMSTLSLIGHVDADVVEGAVDADAKVPESDASVLAALQAQGPMTVADVRTAVDGMSRADTRAVLSRLVEQNMIGTRAVRGTSVYAIRK